MGGKACPSKIEMNTNRFLPLLIIFAFAIVTWVAWNTLLIYPIKLLTVTMHETGHALTAFALGAKDTKISVNKNQGGLTHYFFKIPIGGRTPRWKSFIIASAGYLGSVAIGSLLLYLAYTRVAPGLLLALGIGLLVDTMLFVRDGFTLAICGISIIFCILVGLKSPNPVKVYIIRFIATVSCTYALFDIRDDVLRFGGAQRAGSDAHALQKITHIPYYIWGIIWVIISIVVLYLILRGIMKERGERVEEQEGAYASI